MLCHLHWTRAQVILSNFIYFNYFVDKAKAHLFAKHLFAMIRNVHPIVANLLTASILRFFNDFVEELQCCPSKRFTLFVSDIKMDAFRNREHMHPFILSIMKAAHSTGLVYKDIVAMSQEITKGFVENNYNFVPMKTLVNVLGEQATFATDPRDIMSSINAMSQHFASQTYQIIQLSNACKAMSHDIIQIRGSV